jgi:hypothetical protein
VALETSKQTAFGDYLRVGLIRIEDCCMFTWTVVSEGAPPAIQVFSHHCGRCLEEMKRRGYQVLEDGTAIP